MMPSRKAINSDLKSKECVSPTPQIDFPEDPESESLDRRYHDFLAIRRKKVDPLELQPNLIFSNH